MGAKLDCILGFHKFTKGGVPVSDNLKWKQTHLKDSKGSFCGLSNKDPKQLSGYFMEYENAVLYRLLFTISPNGRELVMIAEPKQQSRLNMPKIEPSQWPKHLTFKKK